MDKLQQVFRHPFVKTLNTYSQVVMKNISTCHTLQKGFHLLQCNRCNKDKYQYHCCGNRHCPYCGTMKREQWIEDRTNELLPTAYYHVVFTLPHELNTLIMGNRKILFDTLFEASSITLLKHGQNPEFLGAEVGITLVLHTWGQDMSFHPHVHCIVTGGGFDGKNWIHAKRKNNKFLFPQKSLAKMYKAIFMGILEQNKNIKWMEDKAQLLKKIKYKNWNVYAKAPFGGPAQVIEYLGRYTHKIAITKHRILEVENGWVKFKYKDYADGNKTKVMFLKEEEFLRRFEQHILPKRYVKIRHTGFLSNHGKTGRLAKIRKSLQLTDLQLKVSTPISIRMLEKYGTNIHQCPHCKEGKLISVFDTRLPRKEKHTTIQVVAPS